MAESPLIQIMLLCPNVKRRKSHPRNPMRCALRGDTRICARWRDSALVPCVIRKATRTELVARDSDNELVVGRCSRNPVYLQAFPSQTFFQPWFSSAESASYQLSVGPKTWTSRSLPPFAFQFR